MVPSRDLTAALEVATRAATLVREVYDRGFSVEWKGENDPVTEADRRANALAVSLLRERFPADAVCSEEGDLDEGARASALGGRCWFVDPLDGTAEFVQRVAQFSVMVGLAVDGRARVGAVVNPVTGERFYGEVGVGAFADDGAGEPRALTPSTEGDPTRARMLTSRSHLSPAVVSLAEALRVASRERCGSIGVKVGRIASGGAELYAHLGLGPKLWDACAPEAIAVAAGMAFTDATGAPVRYDVGALPLPRGLIVCPPAMLARVVAAAAR